MRIKFRPEAEKELLEARNWYEAKARGLGREFAKMAEKAINQAAHAPLAHPQIATHYRRVLLAKFPSIPE